MWSHTTGVSMLDAHNLSMEDLLASSGLSTGSRWFDPYTELWLVLAFCLVILLGLLGNALVAFMLCGNLKSPHHWYLLNLVVADILTCVLCMPFTVLRLTLKDWRLGELLCRIASFLQLTYVFVSVFTILAIAVERYRSIVCSTNLRLDRERIARVVIPCIWLLALGLATPLAVTHRLEHIYDLTGEHVLLTLCVEYWQSETLLGVYTVIILLFQFALPAATIMTLNLLICRFLRMRVHLRTDIKANRKKMLRHRKNLVLLTVIAIIFDVEWLPITVVNIMADFDYMTIFPSTFHFSLTYALCLLFALTSVFVNPVMYGWFNSNFRRNLCGPCRGSGSSDRSSSTFRRGSCETTSRFYTTLVGTSSLSRHHGSMDSAMIRTASSFSQAKLGRKCGSVDAGPNAVLSCYRTKLGGGRE